MLPGGKLPRTGLTAPIVEYLIHTKLSRTTGGFKIIGAGRRTGSIIKATAAIQMLELGADNTLIEGITIEGVQFNGDDLATGGIKFVKAQFSTFINVEIQHVAGTALELYGAQDFHFFGFDVRHSGFYSIDPDLVKPAVYIHNNYTTQGPKRVDSNSLAFFGGDFERNHYTACHILGAYAIGFVRTKFHGRAKKVGDPPVGDDDIPNAVDLLRLEGATRITVTACQFAHARRFAILLTEGVLGTDPINDVIPSTAVLTANTFEETANYQTNNETSSSSSNFVSSSSSCQPGVSSAWNVVLEEARAVVSDNLFAFGTHESYIYCGVDIWLTDALLDAGGVNMHPGFAGTNILRGDIPNLIHERIEGLEVVGTYDSAPMRWGNYYVWVDTSGRLRIRDGAPGSPTGGTVVGTQS